MTDDILFFCAKMMVGHDGLLSDMSVGRASLYQKIPSCPNFYLMWCTLKWNSPTLFTYLTAQDYRVVVINPLLLMDSQNAP
jgi:hypothetical protein